MNKKKDLIEVFGYSPDDLTKKVRLLWKIGGCPFINKACTKINHDKTITYGTCSVTSPYGDVIICPNRLYANNYEVLRTASADAFGNDIPFLTYDNYLEKRTLIKNCIVALGKNSGKEVQVGRSLSMDWILAHISEDTLVEYVGIELQSIDITGNYRDAWYAYKNITPSTDRESLPSSMHGHNWTNVHKRLIPQLIRKGIVYSRSKLVKKGMYFIIPEIVYKKFEDIIGSDIPTVNAPSHEVLTVYTYELGSLVTHGQHRKLVQVRKLRFTMEDLANRFISGPNLPAGEELDNAIKVILGID